MEVGKIDRWIEKLLDCKHLTEQEVVELCEKVWFEITACLQRKSRSLLNGRLVKYCFTRQTYKTLTALSRCAETYMASFTI